MVGGDLVAVVVEGVQVVAGAGATAGAWLEGEQAEVAEAGGDGPAGFGLPPVIDHGFGEQVGSPDGGGGIAALAGEEQGFKFGEVVGAEEFSVRVLLLDGSHGGGGGEQHLHLVLGADAPEGAGVGSAYGFALVHHAGAAAEQGGVDDVAVADDPAYVGGGPVDVAGLDAVDHAHRVPEGDGVASVVADDALGAARRA